MRVLPHCSEKSHSYPVLLRVVRDSGRTQVWRTIHHSGIELGWEQPSFVYVCEGLCVCACMWRSEVNPGSHCACPELRLAREPQGPAVCTSPVPESESVCHRDQISSEEL